MFEDINLVHALTRINNTAAIIINGESGTVVYTTLRGEPRSIVTDGAKSLPAGVFKLVPKPGVEIGDLVAMPMELVIRQLTEAGLIAPDTRH